MMSDGKETLEYYALAAYQLLHSQHT